MTEVTFTKANSTSVSTKTPEPNQTVAFMQICKQADGDGVTGYFTFHYLTQTWSVPVDACTSLIFTVLPGDLTVTEDARAGYQLTDIYTIPADRLISKDISARSATVSIVAGDESSQTVVVFVNRAETAQVSPSVALNTQSTARSNPLEALFRFVMDSLQAWLTPAHPSASIR